MLPPGPGPADVAGADQVAAARREALSIIKKASALVELVEPDGGWSGLRPRQITLEGRGLIAQRLSESRTCPHLRRQGPQPALLALALGRIDCQRCAQTRRNPPPGNDDRCDWCHRHGIELFHPVVVQIGPLIVVGDACCTCLPHYGEAAAAA